MPKTDTRTLITGGAGFIGSHVVDECLARGHTVLVFDNFSVGKRSHLPESHPSLRVVEGDIRDADAMRKVAEAFVPTHVAHLAAIHFIPYCVAHPAEAIDVNIKGTEQVLQAVEAVPAARRVLIASSAAVYGPSAEPHAEEAAPRPMDIYGFTKYANELQADLFHRRTDIPVVMARIFNAYGPRETNPHLIPEIVRQLRDGGGPIRLGNMTTKRSYIFVRDLARGLADLLESARAGCEAFNVGSHHEYDAKEILELLSRVAGRKVAYVSVPERQRASDRPRLQPSLDKIERVTGWREQYDMERGLREILSAQR